MGILLDSSSYKTHQNDVVPMHSLSKRFRYRMKPHSLDHSQDFSLTEMSNSFHPILSNVLSTERAPKDFSISTVLNPEIIFCLFFNNIITNCNTKSMNIGNIMYLQGLH